VDSVALIAPDELPLIRGEWEWLWAEVPDAGPFQSPAWLLPWTEVYAPGRCRAAGLWRDGHLAALVAGFVWQGSLLLAGTGPGDHASPLFAPGTQEKAPSLLEALANAVNEPFDRIDLQQLPPDSPLANAELNGFSAASETGDPCLVLQLGGSDGMANVPKRTRSNWRYSVRRLERERVQLEKVGAEQIAEAAVGLERLHRLRWRAKGEEGVLADDLAARHLRLAIPELARARLLRMHRLQAGTQMVASLFAMRGARSTCYYLSGFDPEWASSSPGTALVGATIAQAAREGCSEFDFLRGQELYKYTWGADDRIRMRRILSRV
jgi:CelD/BcsL family acetyltransferase involved in cellulose biosynthesis